MWQVDERREDVKTNASSKTTIWYSLGMVHEICQICSCS